MAMRERQAFHSGVNYYVPKMAYASNLNMGRANAFSLGTPAAPDNDLLHAGITSNAAAGTETALSWTADSPYGRTITMNPNADPGANGVIDIYGYDYLGQAMVERFTFTSGSTAVLYGKKAFYNIFKSRIVTPSVNATSYDLGTGYRLGLPYKGDLVWARENGVLIPVYKRDQWFDTYRDGALAVAGGSKWILAPFPGFVKTLASLADGGGGATDPVITVELGNVAITGLTVTTDTSVAGHRATDVPTTPGYSANNRFRAGDFIEIVGAAAAGAFGDTLSVELTPTQFTHPVMTDPQTVTTGDPRGTYESIMTMDDVAEIVVGLVPDPSYNASNNGGLHGIRHVVA